MSKKIIIAIILIIVMGVGYLVYQTLFVKPEFSTPRETPTTEIYTHPVYGYSINIPDDWMGKYFVEEKDHIASFVYNSSSDLKYNLFSIVVYSNNEWQQTKSEPGFHGNEITAKDDLVFVYVISLDNPYVGEEGDEYQKMAGDVNNIIKTFKITSGWKVYSNSTYNVTFQYPASWQPYEGEDGFFQLSAISGEGLPIDEVYRFEAYHKLQPYGSQPKIESLKIEGQEARLILPSDDQPQEIRSQAGLIIQYPNPIQISGTTYYYFVLWAEQNHIRKIAETLRFIE